MKFAQWAYAVLALSPMLVAQEVAEDAKEKGAGDAVRYAQVSSEVQLRCFASERSPLYEDVLTEGQVVQVGAKEGDFHRVIVPLGATGYVHKKFVSEPDHGVIKTTGDNVSFRYRPKSSEVPAMMLTKNAELRYLADEGDWWQVCFAGAPAYLAASDLQVFDQPTPTLVASFEEFDQQRRATWQAAVAERDEAIAAVAAADANGEKLNELATKFGVIAAMPPEQQDFDPLEAELVALQAGLVEGSTNATAAAALQADIDRQRLVARAKTLVVAEPPVVNEASAILRPVVADPLEQTFDAVGWLRYETPLRDPDRVVLHKGGHVLYVVNCASGRYDLRMFDGVEVGIKGAKSMPLGDRMRELDVLKMVVLRLPRR